MTRIKVDPAQLAQAAQELAEAAERLQRLADEAHAVGSSAPSYASQFGPKVERLGLEALSALDSQSRRLGLVSDELAGLSSGFSEADQRTEAGFSSLWGLLGEWKQKAEEILPSWLFGWLYRDSGQPTLAQGAEATPTPPGHTPEPKLAPTASWTPVPIGTPTAEQQQLIQAEARAAAKSEWQEKFMDQIDWCRDTSDPDSCIVVAARTVYEHDDLDLEDTAEAGQDNLLSQDSPEFLYLSPIALYNWRQPENLRFVGDELFMTGDHIPNYEPAYLDALKRAHPIEFGKAMLWLKKNEGTIDAAERTMLRELLKVGGAGSE